ncbi:class I SAM-dependent methyltransferase [Phytoactinopolyspora alkaliphila]|uniref:class I SAM-dependent methyltransferase n=1 Tax=Phytoactinopolyspora alkaliphila TaxID=1783498 RepID=UPI001C205B5B
MNDTHTLEQFWESRYAESSHIWSGRVNKTFADVVSGLPPGRALDLGCGEGGDVIWLALRGWQVTGVDVSSTALDRAAEAAARSGVTDGRIQWLIHDLASWTGDDSYDLVSASFFHSPVEIPRAQILSRAAGHVTPGGHLLIVSHADFPPWATGPATDEHRFLTPTEELDQLDLDPVEWDVRIAETRTRETTGPDGQAAVLDDGVVLLRRR